MQILPEVRCCCGERDWNVWKMAVFASELRKRMLRLSESDSVPVRLLAEPVTDE